MLAHLKRKKELFEKKDSYLKSEKRCLRTILAKPNQELKPKSTGEEQLHEHTLFGPDGLYGSKEMAARLANISYSAGAGL